MKESQNHQCFEAFPVPGYVAADHPQQETTKRKPLRNLTKAFVKQRQRSEKTRDAIIAKYKADVQDVWIGPIQLDCKEIKSDQLPVGFVKVSKDRFQYNFKDPMTKDTKRFRPVAYRMPFLTDPCFYDKCITISHLCHNNWCYNWNHHTIETLAVNKARNGCPAGPNCRHTVKCLIPGQYSEC
jgi:hypothetical protein